MTIRVSENVKQQIIQKADEADLSLSAYLRQSALFDESKSRRRNTVSSSEKTQIAIILARLGFIMDGIRDQEATPFLDELTRHILTLRDECFNAMGRQP